jgi:hypothetical protein
LSGGGEEKEKEEEEEKEKEEAEEEGGSASDLFNAADRRVEGRRASFAVRHFAISTQFRAVNGLSWRRSDWSVAGA